MKRLPVRRLGWHRRGHSAPFHTTYASTRWGEASDAEAAWDRARAAGVRWGWAGALCGALVALVWCAPARWVAEGIASATAQRVVLADARGSVWSGSAVLVLTGGPGSRDAAALPGRLAWRVQPRGWAIDVVLQQDCCLRHGVTLRWAPSLSHQTLTLHTPDDWLGPWPASWLAGLGTPWNTLRLGGTARLRASDVAFESVQGRWHMVGGLDLELAQASSRMSTLDTLGSYRLSVQGAHAHTAPLAQHDGTSAGPARITLSTLEGALQLSGQGTWSLAGLRFQGEARAADPNDTALDNLLNIIGQRDGARSVISIG